MRSLISAALRHYPFFDGYDRIALSKPLALFAHFDDFAIAKLRGGERILVPCNDHVGRTLLYMGDLEPRVSHFAHHFLRAGDCVLDIGGNVGWFSIVAATLVGATGTIHSFEPQPRLAAMFRASLAMNKMENVTVHEVALSERDGTADFYVLAGNFGAGRLAKVSGDKWSRTRVKTADANAYLDSLELPAIRLVKIDVEGHEDPLFRNARAFLEHNKPDAIVFESIGDDALLDRPVSRLLCDLGYRLLTFEPSFTKAEPIPVHEGQTVASIDHLALRDGVTL